MQILKAENYSKNVDHGQIDEDVGKCEHLHSIPLSLEYPLLYLGSY